MRSLYASLLLLVCVSPLLAEDKFDPEARARVVAPYLDEQTIGLVHIDLQRLDTAALLSWVADLGLVERAELTEPKHMADAFIGGLRRTGVPDMYVVLSLADLPQSPLLVFPINDKTNVEGIGAVCDLAQMDGHEKIGSAFVCGKKSAVERVKGMKPMPRPEVAKAFAAAGDTAVQALLLPTADARRLLEESVPRLPKEIGGGPVTTLTRGCQWGAVGLQLPPKPAAHVTVQAQDAKSATELKQLLNNALVLLSQHEEVSRTLPNLADIVPALSPQVQGDRLTLTFDDKKPEIVKFLSSVGRKVRTAAEDARELNHLKEIATAIHMHANDHKNEFPRPAIVDKNDKPLLSWRVQLLPYLNQGELYKKFHLDEAWDSEHNKKLIEQMPDVFASPALKGKKGLTTILAPIGDDTIFGGKKPVRFADIVDGTANTIMVVDVVPEKAVVWTMPDDWTFVPTDPSKDLLAKDQKSFKVLFADGSARSISNKIDMATLKALFTRSGGEVIGEIP